MSDTLMEQLKASQMLVIAMAQIVAADHPGRVGAWTLRDIAAHLAATETECFEPRIRAMAAGERPEFEFYSNDERDFDGISLQAALTEWTETRTRVIEFIRGLSEEERSRVGVHTKFGELTVDGYLQVALDHDQDHLKSLERLVTQAAH
jgi:hypothetical protein